MAKDQTVVEDANGNVTVNKRNNISVDKTDVVLEDLCCPCGCCCYMNAIDRYSVSCDSHLIITTVRCL